jgi:hypothetical protein
MLRRYIEVPTTPAATMTRMMIAPSARKRRFTFTFDF